MPNNISIQIRAETRTGSRYANEDSHLVIPGSDLPGSILAVAAVADGIGGMGNGHVASSTALTTVADTFRRLAAAHKGGADPPLLDWLAFCFHKANSHLFRMSSALPELRGMGTTCTAAAITRSHLYICHVGDSRAYLWRDGALKQLTQDEWYQDLRQTNRSRKAEDSRPSSRQGVTLVNQAIGWQPMITPSKITEPLLPADGIMLCTDGLSDSLDVHEIERLIAANADLAGACPILADEAASRPNSDNVTIICARQTGARKK